MQRYSNEIRESMVQKLCLPNRPSVLQLSKDSGIPHSTLKFWIRKFGSLPKMVERRPKDWTAKERFKAICDANGLSDEELGEFLRKAGLHSHQLAEWERQFIAEVEGKPRRGRPKKDPEVITLESKVKQLERDLRRKNNALAEQSALLILQKKANEMWSKYEDDE